VLDDIERLSGQVFNLGGGPQNAVSLREVIREIGKVVGRDVPLKTGAWRKGDQLWFVADTRRLEREIGWRAGITWREGLRDLADWLGEARIAGVERERLTA
jgi:CDP-paratose 2-epimerase